MGTIDQVQPTTKETIQRGAWPIAVQAILAHTATPAGAEQAIGQSNITSASEQAVS